MVSALELGPVDEFITTPAAIEDSILKSELTQ
jgi:hypothetical protein